MDTIVGMRTFVAVAAELSFTQGANRVGISTKMASKYIGQLESKLGVQLFNRTTRSVTLTETGRSYYERCIPLLDQFDELEGLVQSQHAELAGPIRLTAPTGFGSSQLVEAIAPFQLNHPKVNFDLQLSDHLVAVVEEGFDLAIRFGKLEDSSLIARRLMNMRVVICASPKYLKEHGKPEHPKALSTHNCLLLQTPKDNESWEFKINNKVTSFRVNGSSKANSPRAIAHLAANGLGIGRCPLYAVEPFLRTGKLELLFEDIEATEFALYAIYPHSRHLTARIRAFIDHLIEHYQQ